MNNATELLRRALAELIDQDETIRAEFCGMQLWRSPPIIKEIYDYLAAEPEVEPVGYAVKMIPRGLHFIGFVGEEETEEEIKDYGPDQIVLLYTRTEPKRKPMTEEKIIIEFNSAKKQWFSKVKAFEAGVRFAEKHHKIGDEE